MKHTASILAFIAAEASGVSAAYADMLPYPAHRPHPPLCVNRVHSIDRAWLERNDGNVTLVKAKSLPETFVDGRLIFVGTLPISQKRTALVFDFMGCETDREPPRVHPIEAEAELAPNEPSPRWVMVRSGGNTIILDRESKAK